MVATHLLLQSNPLHSTPIPLQVCVELLRIWAWNDSAFMSRVLPVAAVDMATPVGG